MIGRAIVGLFIAVSLWLYGCSTTATLGTAPVTDPGYYNTRAGMGGAALPTPQFMLVDADIDHGRIMTIRLRQNPAWKAQSEQPVFSDSMSQRQTIKGTAAWEAGRAEPWTYQHTPQTVFSLQGAETSSSVDSGNHIVGRRALEYDCPDYVQMVLQGQVQFETWQEAEAGYWMARDCR